MIEGKVLMLPIVGIQQCGRTPVLLHILLVWGSYDWSVLPRNSSMSSTRSRVRELEFRDHVSRR